MKKLVIVGCGRLAEIVADAVVKGLLADYNLVGVYSRTASKAAHIVNKMQQHGKPCIACATLEELLALKQIIWWNRPLLPLCGNWLCRH